MGKLGWKVLVVRKDERLVPYGDQVIEEMHIKKITPTKVTIAVRTHNYVERKKPECQMK